MLADLPQLQLEKRALEMLAALSYRTSELDGYLQQIAQSVRELMDLDWSVVTLCSGQSERILASTIDMGEDRDRVFELHGTLTATVFSSGEPLVVDDATVTTTYGAAPEGYRAYLGVPLRTPSGRVLGTICSFQQRPRHFSKAEINLAIMFAERAATALDNFQLYREQQQTSERLRQSEEQLRQIVENLDQVFWMYACDRQPWYEGTPVYISPAFETVWGHACEEWHRQPKCWQQAIHPGDRDRVLNLIAESGEREWNAEYRIIRPDGAVRLIRDRAFPIHDDAGRVYRMAGIAEDITERHQAQQGELRALERLAEIGELAASVVHEVRNPLTTVVMGLTSVRQMSLDKRADMRLDLALDEADRLRRLLDEILLYAKPRDLNHAEVELCELLAGMLPSLKNMPSARNREIELVDRLDRAPILGDADKLKQVFINLVDNACEAISAGDRVTCHIEPGVSSKWIVVRVHNGGPPIPPDALQQLTKPFFTTKSSGNGLGLAIVQRIVESHSGELTITSAPEAGTTVSIQLPLQTVRQRSQLLID